MNADIRPDRQAGCGTAMTVALLLGVVALLLAAAVLLGVLLTVRMQSGPIQAVVVPQTAEAAFEVAEHVTRPPDAQGPASDANTGQGKPSPDLPAGQNLPAACRGRSLIDLRPLEIIGVRLDGGELTRRVRLAGQWHERGLWAKPVAGEGTSQLSYLVDAKFTRLRGIAGLNEPDEHASPTDRLPTEKSTAVFRVYGDGNLLWESQPLQDQGSAQTFTVDLTGISVVAMAVESSDAQHAPDCVWGGLELEPAPP